jgi:hypothetical protein
LGELKFFLGFQIKQLKDGTFISQTKYTNDMLKKFDMNNAKPIKTPLPSNGHLDLNEEEKALTLRESVDTWFILVTLFYGILRAPLSTYLATPIRTMPVAK